MCFDIYSLSDHRYTLVNSTYSYLVRLLVHSKETQLLDPNQVYPCPSCKQGALVPITLTEAWGCDRCKQIFELRSEPNTIEKLTTPYPRQQIWLWTGKHWVLKSSPLKDIVTALMVWARLLLLPALFWVCWTLLSWAGLSFLMKGALILLTLVVMFWLVLRR